MKFLTLFIIALASLTLPVTSQQKSLQEKKVTRKAVDPVVSFKTDVFPVMKRFCLPCHTEDQYNPSNLYLDSYDNLMHGGKHGSPVIPGRPDTSLLVLKISLKPPFGDPMPLRRKTPFPEDTLAILKKWISQGGKNN